MTARGSMVRCAASSLAAVSLEFALLSVFVSVLRLHYLAGSALATCGYLGVNFTINRRWAFGGARTRSARGQLVRHLGSAAVGMSIGTTLLWLLVDTARLPYQLGWACSGLVVFTGWTWPTSRAIFGSTA